MANFIFSSPNKDLIITSVVSSITTVGLMSYGIGNVVNSITACITHPVSAFFIGGIAGFAIGAGTLALMINNKYPEEYEKIFSSNK